jgi:hypothetical protein
MKRTLLLSTVFAALVLEGYVHGLWTNRWNSSRDLEEAVSRLQRVPLTFGDWRGEERELEARITKQAGFAGYLLRRYENRQTGTVVNVLLACGSAGPLSVHTPEVCYGGAGYSLAGEAGKQVVPAAGPSPGAEFRKGTFTKKDALVPTHLQVLWSWHAKNVWTVSDNPRLSFAGLPVLHKMYVTSQWTGSDERQEAVCAEFMTRFLPELERALFSES